MARTTTVEQLRSKAREGVGETLDRVRTRAVEVGIYLPLGAYATLRDEITDLDRKRIGKLFEGLIDRGQDRLQPIERVVRRRTNQVENQVEAAAQDAQRQVRKTAKKTVKRAKAASTSTSPAAKLPRVAAPKNASELPIAGYNSLTVEEVLNELRGLTQTDLAKVYKYERANDNRKTILDAIDSKFVTLPIPTYDALTVDEIVGRLDGLSEGELKTIRRYEEESKQRATVIEKIDSLLG